MTRSGLELQETFLELSQEGGGQEVPEERREQARQGTRCEQSDEVKETRPASLRLTPSPVLRSAYRRSVLAPSPDTDSEWAVSQATVVITEI